MHRIKKNSLAVKDLLEKWKKLRKLKNRCVVCGERDKIVFDTHHLDGNRKNPSRKNILKNICASCHSITWKAKTTKKTKDHFIKRHRRVSPQVKAWRNTLKERGTWFKNPKP